MNAAPKSPVVTGIESGPLNAGMIAALHRSQAVIEFSLDGRILDANENFCSALGYSPDEIRGQHHSMFVDAATFVGIVVLSLTLNNARTRASLDAGANSLIAVPFSAGQNIAHVKFVSSKSWRFIDASNYFGPDRRVREEFHNDYERRSAQCRILEGERLAAERLRMRSTALAAFEIKVAHTA